jgi:hypothetical protein
VRRHESSRVRSRNNYPRNFSVVEVVRDAAIVVSHRRVGGLSPKGIQQVDSGVRDPFFAPHSRAPQRVQSVAKVWSAAKVTKAPAPRYCVLFLTVIRHRRQERTAIESHRVSHDDEGNLARTCSLRSHAWESVGRMEGTSICTRISPFAGRVTEATAVRKDRLVAERAGLRPSRQHVSRCSDALRARAGDIEVSGRRRAGAHRWHCTFACRPPHPRLAICSRPARVMFSQEI